MRISDDRFPSLKISAKSRRFNALMDKYMRKVALANSEETNIYIGGDEDILNILAYRDKIQRKGHI